ncbi:MAG: MltA domain-containing protein [Syntrophobacteraceae bacterium]|nr:murein transglycosylase A [Desulfobacteraceae bacterium]
MNKLLVWGIAFLFLTACTPGEQSTPPAAFELVPPDEVPQFTDSLDSKSLRDAIAKSLSFYERQPPGTTFPMDTAQIPVETLKTTMVEFSKLLDSGRLNRENIAQSFDIYRVSHKPAQTRLLITGYYEPLLEAQLERDRFFCYPLYGLPSDLLIIDLSTFDNARFSGQRLMGRAAGKKVVPYYSRAEIDGGRKLEGLAGTLAWLRDPIDAFFLHIQGSGILQLPDGKYVRVGYAGTNGRPYRSIGKVLLEKGVLSPEEVSLQTIRTYLRAHPEIRDKVLWQNESYVFFQWVQDGPKGNLNVTLTSGRSLACDPRYYPRGALAFLQIEQPRVEDSAHGVSGPLDRWVLNQDTGGAIKGVGRVDLFCGTGEAAETMAGPLKSPGQIYVVIKKAMQQN